MGWIRLNTGFMKNPRVISLATGPKLLYISGLLYCAAQENDGLLNEGDVRVVAAEADVPRECVQDLVRVGLWVVNPEGGYVVPGYLEYNPSREQAQRRRKANAGVQQTYRERHGPVRNDLRIRDGPDYDPDSNEINKGGSNAITNGVSHQTGSPLVYDPTYNVNDYVDDDDRRLESYPLNGRGREEDREVESRVRASAPPRALEERNRITVPLRGVTPAPALACGIPDEFPVLPWMAEWAAVHAKWATAARLEPITAKFHAHHQALGTVRVNWDAEWKNWMLAQPRFDSFSKEAPFGQHPSSPAPPRRGVTTRYVDPANPAGSALDHPADTTAADFQRGLNDLRRRPRDHAPLAEPGIPADLPGLPRPGSQIRQRGQ